MVTSCDMQRLPLGETSFVNIRENNKIYVDKTELLYPITQYCVPHLITRPNRFGKSLLINTLVDLYTNGLEHFKGLAIEKVWNEPTRPVIYLDFSAIAHNTANKLRENLNKTLIEQFNLQSEDAYYEDGTLRSPQLILGTIARSNKKPILLIDEYDAPFNDTIANEQEVQAIKSTLFGIYATIKSYTGQFKFILITGVTRICLTNMFSGFNNVRDLSFKSDVNKLLGFTQNELEQYFDTYIENASQVLNMSKQDVYARLEEYYGGFGFSQRATQTVYNPSSIINFLHAPQEGFKNYWAEYNGNKSLILNSLNINGKSELITYHHRYSSVDNFMFEEKYDIREMPLDLLLYQSGYFTIHVIKEYYPYLAFPNIEVEESFLMLYLEINNLKPSAALQQKIATLIDKIDDQNLKQIIDIFNAILNEYIIDPNEMFRDTRAVRDIIYAALMTLPGLQIIKQRVKLYGSPDIALVTKKTCMIIAFQTTSEQCKPQEALTAAYELLEKNQYAERFAKTHAIYSVAMVIIDDQQKILDEFCGAVHE
ncbi:MAG: AAA family ATPase [Desulfovibrionaceae bacterium]|nr:AAA family ATPase [Desulfovibrionaceae bacterium]